MSSPHKSSSSSNNGTKSSSTSQKKPSLPVRVIRWTAVQIVSFVLAVLILGIWYAAVTWTNIPSGSWAAGQPVTQTLMQGIIDNINDLNSRVATLNSTPAGAIMAFNLTTCPTGWVTADGTNGTPDLRGEFIRGLDSWRGVDVGRTLRSWQRDIFSNHHHAMYYHKWSEASSWISDEDWLLWIYIDTDKWYYTNNTTITWTGWSETRPRNIALLYCQKQ